MAEYDYTTPGGYFVTICIQDRRHILSDIVGDDAHIVLKPYGRVIEKYIQSTPEIEKYVIMPDHIHMIIRLANAERNDAGILPDDKPVRPAHNRVASIVRSIKVLTTKEIGEPIFQRSYYDHVIRNQQDYEEVWEYIDGNPSKWMEKSGTK